MSQKIKVLNTVEGLARSICLPGDTAPQRYPSFPALERTAVMAFNNPDTMPVPSTTTQALLMRQATYPLWVTSNYSTAWIYCVTTNIDPGTYEAIGLVDYAAAGTTSTPSTAYPELQGDVPPWGAPLMAQDAATGTGIWVYARPGAYQTAAVVTTSIAPNTSWQGSLIVDIWSGPGRYFSRELSFTGTASKAFWVDIGSQITAASWLRIRSVNFDNFIQATLDSEFDAAATLVVSNSGLYLTGGSSTPVKAVVTGVDATRWLYPMSYPKEFVNSHLPWANTKTTAVSALFTNVTKIQNKEGTVLWGRMNPTLVSPWKAVKTDISSLHPSEKAFLPLETGCYTYVAPSTDMNDFVDYTYLPPISAKRVPLVNLGSTALYNFGIFEDADGATMMAVNLDWHIEFRSSSTLFQIGYSQLPVEALHQAQLKLASSGYFFKNDTHERILSAVAKSLKTVATVGTMLGPVGRGVAIAAKAAQHLIPNQRASQMRTTTAKASGWMGRGEARSKSKRKTNAGHNQPKKASSKKPDRKRASGLQMYLDTQRR